MIEMSGFQYRGVRYNRINSAFGAALDDIDNDFKKLTKEYERELKGYIERVARNVTDKFKQYKHGKSPYDRLMNRTGRAKRELRASPTVRRTDGNKFNAAYIGRVTGPDYLNIQEDGGWLTAKSGKYITIPLPAALNPNGTPKKRSMSEWRNTFTKKTRKGAIVVFHKKGGKAIPIYVLKKRVYIKPRLRLGEGFDRAAPYYERKLLDTIQRELAGVF